MEKCKKGYFDAGDKGCLENSVPTVKEVTEGFDTCKRLETIQECEDGAKSLGLSVTTARQIEDWASPPNCFYRA